MPIRTMSAYELCKIERGLWSIERKPSEVPVGASRPVRDATNCSLYE
jgi:hypothetical protein